MDEDLYETDFYTWTQRQAEHLRAGRLDHADLANIAEEIDGLGKSQVSALRSAYREIAEQLLKATLRPAKPTRRRRCTVCRERLNVEQHLADSPGLEPRRAELFGEAYAVARRIVAILTGLPLSRFPLDPPFTVDEAEAEDFWPTPTL